MLAVKSALFFVPEKLVFGLFPQKQVLKFIKLAGLNKKNYKFFRKVLILWKLENENNLHFT